MLVKTSHRWITDSIHDFSQYDVGSHVPPVFESYARIFHPAYLGEAPVTWRTVARRNNRVAHPAMEWGSLVGSWTVQSQERLWDRAPCVGRLPMFEAKELARILKQFLTIDNVTYALWQGYGIIVKNADTLEVPNRPMYVVSSSIENASEPFGVADPAIDRWWTHTANLWWASDRTWCVATDIDLMTTYVGANTKCVDKILGSNNLEAMPVTSSQLVTWEADTINPRPDPPGFCC